MDLRRGQRPGEAESEDLRVELQGKERELASLKERLQDLEKASQKNERLLNALVEEAAGKIGQDYFDHIVFQLSKWLNAECVLIGQMVEDERIKAVPLYLDGDISHGFSYALAGSPCDIATRKGYCAYPDHVVQRFPNDRILIDLHAEGYIGTALYNKTGKTVGVICAVSRGRLQIPPHARDIMKMIGARVSAEIERLNMEQALQQSEAELKASNATKDKLLSIIAHDLRNPFNSILGCTELLLRGHAQQDPQKQRTLLEVTKTTAQKASSLLENLLAWALSQGNTITYHPETLLLEAIVSESAALLNSMAQGRSITLANQISPDFIVKADRQMLSAIIRNLLSNAIKFTPPGGKVALSATTIAGENGEMAEIHVQDNGVGMDSDALARLFRMDGRHVQPRTCAEQGTGLGLILCKDFVERNGGTIRAESKPGAGSTFVFTLRVA